MTLEDTESEPVFVVGMNGSGTTMLLDCLGRHPSLYAFPKETRLIPYLMARQSAYGDLRVDANYRALWEDVRNLAVFREVNAHAPVPLPDDWREQPRSLAAVLDRVFCHFAAGRGKRRWAEKTPQHVQHLLAVIAAWGGCPNPVDCPADIAPPGGNDVVNVEDWLGIIGAWGPCP